MQHIKQQLDNYKDLSMAQFNHIKQNNITEYNLTGDIQNPKHDLLQYLNEKGELITVFNNGEIYQD